MSANENVLIIERSLSVGISPRESVKKIRAERVDPYSPASTRITTRLFLSLAAVVLATGWMIRGEEYLTAKEGVGYYLGIVGGVLLLLQFAYPLRKSLGFMRSWGAVKHWFRIHKMLGLVGPVLILYHSNFRLHAVNSNVALFSMLLVVISGLVGRYIYTKIHSNHYGELLTLQELQRAFGISRDEMEHEKYITRRVKQHLHDFEDEVFHPAGGFLAKSWKLLTLGHRTRSARARAYRELEHGLHVMGRRNGWSNELVNMRLEHDRELVRVYLKSVCRVVEFRFFRRLFSLWHMLHIPLFAMLVVTGIVHVIAVHMY